MKKYSTFNVSVAKFRWNYFECYILWHVNNIIKEEEPDESLVCAIFARTKGKSHSFSDGKKRTAAPLFLWFLNGNGILYNEDVTKRIADNTLVALILMIAESRTEDKDTIVKVIVNLINKNNWFFFSPALFLVAIFLFDGLIYRIGLGREYIIRPKLS